MTSKTKINPPLKNGLRMLVADFLKIRNHPQTIQKNEGLSELVQEVNNVITSRIRKQPTKGTTQEIVKQLLSEKGYDRKRDEKGDYFFEHRPKNQYHY